MARLMYKNKSNQTQVVIGVGEVQPEARFVVSDEEPINNPNFELLGEFDEQRGEPKVGVDPKASVPQREEVEKPSSKVKKAVE